MSTLAVINEQRSGRDAGSGELGCGLVTTPTLEGS